MTAKIFISHSSSEAALASHLCAYLEKRDIICWIAPRDIPAGSAFDDEINKAIFDATAIVLLFSQKADGSPHIKRELVLATDYSKPIFPVRIEDIYPDRLRYQLATSQWLDWFDKRDEALEKLTSALVNQNTDHEFIRDLEGIKKVSFLRSRKFRQFGSIIALSSLIYLMLYAVDASSGPAGLLGIAKKAYPVNRDVTIAVSKEITDALSSDMYVSVASSTKYCIGSQGASSGISDLQCTGTGRDGGVDLPRAACVARDAQILANDVLLIGCENGTIFGLNLSDDGSNEWVEVGSLWGSDGLTHGAGEYAIFADRDRDDYRLFYPEGDWLSQRSIGNVVPLPDSDRVFLEADFNIGSVFYSGRAYSNSGEMGRGTFLNRTIESVNILNADYSDAASRDFAPFFDNGSRLYHFPQLIDFPAFAIGFFDDKMMLAVWRRNEGQPSLFDISEVGGTPTEAYQGDRYYQFQFFPEQCVFALRFRSNDSAPSEEGRRFIALLSTRTGEFVNVIHQTSDREPTIRRMNDLIIVGEHGEDIRAVTLDGDSCAGFGPERSL